MRQEQLQVDTEQSTTNNMHLLQVPRKSNQKSTEHSLMGQNDFELVNLRAVSIHTKTPPVQNIVKTPKRQPRSQIKSQAFHSAGGDSTKNSSQQPCKAAQFEVRSNFESIGLKARLDSTDTFLKKVQIAINKPRPAIKRFLT